MSTQPSNQPQSPGRRLSTTGHWLLALARGTLRRFRAHDCSLLAAGLAFYTTLSLFPLLLVLTAIFGPLLAGTDLQQQLIASVGNAFPGSADLITRTFNEVARGQRTIGVVSLVTLILSASQIFVGIRRALNRAWGVTHTHSFLHRRLLEAAMLGSVILLVLASWAAVSLFSVVRPLLPATLAVPGTGPVAGTIAALTSFALSLGVFALLYRFVPKANVSWGDVRLGALLAAILFEVGKYAFSWYLTSFARYSLIYGSLGTTIVFLMWSYLSALILLLGAELTAEYARLRRQRSARQ